LTFVIISAPPLQRFLSIFGDLHYITFHAGAEIAPQLCQLHLPGYAFGAAAGDIQQDALALRDFVLGDCLHKCGNGGRSRRHCVYAFRSFEQTLCIVRFSIDHADDVAVGDTYRISHSAWDRVW